MSSLVTCPSLLTQGWKWKLMMVKEIDVDGEILEGSVWRLNHNHMMMKTNYILQLCPVQPRDGLGLSWRHRWWDFKAGSQFSIYPWIEMSWTEEHYDSEHYYDCAQNILSIVFYVWSGVLLFLHCGVRPLPRGRSNESKNNFMGKEIILQKG